ncbi:MAG: Rrf2 family transcriptional regulator [Oscillospiraceae bacterium]|nr:Rrf2 family transcriptional regulator [Oscillospiraceae bacterium]
MYISTKCSVAIHCLVFIYEYGNTKKVTSELLSFSTGSNSVTIRNILSALKKDGIISIKFGTGGATLVCPLNEISLYRICKAIEPDFIFKLIGVHALPSAICPVGRNIHNVLDASYQKIKKDLCDSLERITMEDIVADYHRSLQEGKTDRSKQQSTGQ